VPEPVEGPGRLACRGACFTFARMKNLVVTVKDQKELVFLTDLMQKLGLKSRVMSETETEDTGLLEMMKEADRDKKVSRTKVMKALGK